MEVSLVFQIQNLNVHVLVELLQGHGQLYFMVENQEKLLFIEFLDHETHLSKLLCFLGILVWEQVEGVSAGRILLRENGNFGEVSSQLFLLKSLKKAKLGFEDHLSGPFLLPQLWEVFNETEKVASPLSEDAFVFINQLVYAELVTEVQVTVEVLLETNILVKQLEFYQIICRFVF